MNIEVALQRYKDVFLPDVIDNSQGDFLAKHVPMRNLLLIDHDEPTDNDKKNPLTEKDIYMREFFLQEMMTNLFLLKVPVERENLI